MFTATLNNNLFVLRYTIWNNVYSIVYIWYPILRNVICFIKIKRIMHTVTEDMILILQHSLIKTRDDKTKEGCKFEYF